MTTTRINNQRRCVVTQTTYDKDKLIRIVRLRDGKFLANSDVQGRGAYVLAEKSVMNELVRKRALNRAFKMNVPQETYDELIKVIIAKSDK